MHEYEISVLELLKKRKSCSVDAIEKDTGLGRDSAVWALQNLAKSGMVSIDADSIKRIEITEEGKSYLDSFPEERLARELQRSGGSKRLSEIKDEIGKIWAKRNGWIEIKGNAASLTHSGEDAASGRTTYPQRAALSAASRGNLDEKGLAELRKRGLVKVSDTTVIKGVAITTKGASADTGSDDGAIGQLTRDIISSGKWKGKRLREYDISASQQRVYPARLHPVHEFMDVVREAWLNMGFTEVSGPIIESAFWNFDALFSPQDHPTREMQDTFFLSNPKTISIEDVELLSRVKRMHVKSWKGPWRRRLAEQALLRTHTTSVSARYINKLASSDTGFPARLFSIGRVFRNESTDYKHLAEFYQSDGIIIGNGLTLSNLISTLRQFYAQLGIEEVRIKPSYFPFVEPGLEVYYHDEEKDEDIELCGGGIIRKEITKAMGTRKTVLAWGAALERLMFKELGIRSITELYSNNVGWLRERRELALD